MIDSLTLYACALRLVNRKVSALPLCSKPGYRDIAKQIWAANTKHVQLNMCKSKHALTLPFHIASQQRKHLEFRRVLRL